MADEEVGEPIEQFGTAPEPPSNESQPRESGQPETGQLTHQSMPVVIDEQEESEDGNPLPYPVVGIGASAGGVEAYIELFSSLANNTGMAFIVIPHLLADRKSHLVEIIARQTSMPVHEITSGTRPEPDRIYVLPPNARVSIKKGLMQLETRVTDGIPRPIDYFFRTLSSDQKNRAIGVILSGTDADGALGLKAIKGEGGITMVQSPESARFSEMPISSIAIDHVDRILTPGHIAVELAEIGKQFYHPSLRPLEEGEPQPGDEQPFSRILTLLRSVSGVDFRLYKPSTIRRRIARRMLLHRLDTLGEYLVFVQGNAKELRDLQEDALINVTRFFRDPTVWDSLKSVILPRILDDRESDQQVRIWVAGCSSGEEVYSIAMCLLEYLTGQPFEPPIQIFGTDASDQNIHRARMGIYPESIVGEVSPERLRRFFTKIDKGYQIAKRVRDMCIFARQNLCHDPPFSKMDLISCRNVLIYLGTELQKQILPVFHYALRQNGILLLGTSETIRDFTELFQIIDRRHKFFAKTGNGTGRAMMTIAPRLALTELPPPGPVALTENWADVDLQRAADRIVLARYGPPGVVVDEKMEILQSRGHTAPFLEMAPGSVSLQLTRMLRDRIASQVTQAVRRSIVQDVPVRVEGVRVSDDDHEREVALEVLPIHTVAPRSRCFLVLFSQAQPARMAPSDSSESAVAAIEPKADGHAIERLRQDLASTKLYLQTLLEERDAKNQELVSANEEIQSANEEMQSTNEELETTKEELQSSNEELQTVNDELQQRNAILTQTSNDLTNLLNSVNLPVLMLSNELAIRHFTPPTQKLMNLRAPDVGRPFSEIRMNLNIDDLEPLFADVLETLAPREIEVQDREGRWYLLRVRPYRTTDNKIEGVVVVLLDIDQHRRSQQDLRAARDFSRSVIESVPLPLAVVDLDLRIRAVNDAFRNLSGVNREELDYRSLPDLAAIAWGLDEPLRSQLENLRGSKDLRGSFEFEHVVNGEPTRIFDFRGRVLHPDGELFLLITIEDVTARKELERLLGAERERLASEVASTARELGRTQDELRALAGSLINSHEDERRRVARELHDDIGQKLTVLGIQAGQIEESAAGDSGKIIQEIAKMREAIGALAEDVRSISHALHPSLIDDLGAAPAIRDLVEEFREMEEMIVTFTAEGLPDKIPTQIATGLYRITQEALRNVSKHAGRTHVKVGLEGGPGVARLHVRDYGEGFDASQQRSGLGLVSMEERARLMGGTFHVDSKPGEGTRITVEVPLPEST